MADELLDLGPSDYALCREALDCLDRHESSPARVFAAARYGGRDMWAEVAHFWEQAQERAGGPVAHVRVLKGDTPDTVTVQTWEGDLDSYQDRDPLPWEQEG